MVQIISASRHPHGINSGWYHPDWSQFVRWRHYHLGQNAMGAPCPEILSQFEVWLTNLQEVRNAVFLFLYNVGYLKLEKYFDNYPSV